MGPVPCCGNASPEYLSFSTFGFAIFVVFCDFSFRFSARKAYEFPVVAWAFDPPVSVLPFEFSIPGHMKMRLGFSAVVCICFVALGTGMASADDTLISGYLKLSGGSVTLPAGSTYVVELEDISLMDAPSEVLGIYKGRVDNVNEGRMQFEILFPESERNKRRHRRLALSAVINVGWERAEGSQEWIRKGDFLSDTIHMIELNEEGNHIRNFPIVVKRYT